ncbi:MAG: hypothetical protein GDA49_10050 [Rhodospirillales bacterium]|nr:hypothetical protein [Rhodospirillales bacterium]
MAHSDQISHDDSLDDDTGAQDMTTLSRSMFFFIPCLVLIVTGWPANAQEPRTLGTYRDWSAFAYQDGSMRVCYIATEPTDSQGNYTQRGDVWVQVTHRTPGGNRDVISIIAGYNYEEESPVTVTVGDRSFELFSRGDTAWTYTEGDDRNLIAAMKAGVDMTVKGRSWRGTDTTDTVSLLGFTAAYETISRACVN